MRNTSCWFLLTVLLGVGTGNASSEPSPAAATTAAAPAAKTIVLRTTGDLKARHLRRFNKSIAKTLSATAQWGPRAKGALPIASCAVDTACLIREGERLGAEEIAAVYASYYGDDATVVFIAVSVKAKAELGRSEVLIKRRKFARAPGPMLKEFLASEPVADARAAVGGGHTTAPPAPTAALAPAAAPTPAGASAPAATPPPAAPASIPEPDATTNSSVTSDAAPVAETSTAFRVEATARKPIHVGLSTGVVFPQLSSQLNTNFSVKLEGGYAVWRNLSVFGAVGYTQPRVESNLDDPRLVAGDYMTDTTQRELTTTLGAMWRWRPPGARINAYGALGWRMWMLKTVTTGVAGGESFLENEETSTRQGAAAVLGGEYTLGPGAIIGEFDLGGSDLPHLVTGDVATTSLAINFGYRMLL